MNVRPSALLTELFPPGVIAVESRDAFVPDRLHPEEAQCVLRAVPKRVSEFAAGRACARAALAALQIADFPLLVGPNREPLWPEGVRGSITHSGGFCGVVVVPADQLLGIGVDAEQARAVRRDLWAAVTTSAELVWLHGLPETQAHAMASVIFSAKEAFFKCQYPLTHQWLGFADVQVSIGAGIFHIHPSRELQLESHAPAPWGGRFGQEDGLIATGIAVARRGTSA